MKRTGLPWSILLLLGVLAYGAEEKPSGRVLPKLRPLRISPERGFFTEPFSAALVFPSTNVLIRVTTDGSAPTAVSGREYTGPLQITNTTILRAAAFESGSRVSAVVTHTYLFLDQVLRQPKDPPGVPAGPKGWNGMPSAYAMDSRVVNDPVYKDQMIAALKVLPTVSIACRRDDMFSPRTGLYLNSMQRGQEWEKPCSVELILLDERTGFQIDCGIRIQGNSNRIPEKSPKHAFRLLFKEEYGSSKLHYQVFPDSPVAKFDTLVLRADYNNSWVHWDARDRPRGQRTRDAWMKDSFRDMGRVASHNRYFHLYINGLYWGIYDATERPDATFAAAYLGGNKEEYDVINEFQAKDGTLQAFRAFLNFRGVTTLAGYEKLQQQLDLTEFIDYSLLNYYAGNRDWGERKNWYAIRRHGPESKWQYFIWDGEHVFEELDDDTVNAPFEVPFRLAQNLAANPEYRLAFADRVQKHFFEDGALTPKAAAERWMKRAGEVDLAIIAESARWGYYRRNPPFTKKEYLTEQRRLLNTYFPQRTQIVLEQLRQAGLYPRIAAPAFNQHGGALLPRFKLSMSAQNGGTIYFTTDHADPRIFGSGAMAPSAETYASPVPLRLPVIVKARVLKSQQWSALSEATFTNAPFHGK